MVRHDYEVLWAIVRLDPVPMERAKEDPSLLVTIKAVVPDESEARREVERLNALGPAQAGDAIYFVAPARFFAEGRDVQVDY